MATHFAFVRVGVLTSHGNVPGLRTYSPISGETITASASNQQTTVTAPDTPSQGEVFCRVATTVDVYVAFGSNPNAETGTGTRFLVPLSAVEYFAVAPGYKAAVVTA
jgi:hypothetical protein